ncbi:MAG TPA: hypothetical protein VF135_09730 [Terriglobales bacterium]
MRQQVCECGHEKGDHRPPRRGIGMFGECRICLCAGFRKPPPPEVLSTVLEEYSRLRSGAPVMDWILERLEHKNSPQGLNVIAEELRWLGQGSITHEKLVQAVSAEMRKARPRIEAVAEEVYWVAGKCTPPGWSLFGDRRMLPCFYREYPPDISWEQIDRPENILPSPVRVVTKR